MTGTSEKEKAWQKPANEVSLSFLAQARGLPKKIELSDCNLSFYGESGKAVKPVPGLITGVFGLSSKQQALVAAARWSKEREYSPTGSNRVLMVDVNYKIENYSLTRNQLTEDLVAQTGWLHMERIASKYRKEIVAKWIEWIRQDFNDTYASSLVASDTSLLELARMHPRYVFRTMEENPGIRAIIHPVNPVIATDSVLLAATVRYNPEFFGVAHVRFTTGISVVI